ncbi:PepSY domain-containing protein [Sphingobium sp. SCG-1]|uniref:PepSY-associated TM helix domain-containing protein n=1 Tax=Sphingobium sp. SCG-1 TaxID=2072936 RepID=UPI000CD69B19|nr:PepSY domain-containing protein [Sphingobium sp. SCG-1]AUW56769.1 PepSY domain-containing protein [Sphingobium sp. SCG-1]
MDGTSFYRTIWRWHFYAGLIVLPVLLWLATTGALYLYKPEIERAYYGAWTQRHFGSETTSLAQIVRNIEIQTKGRVTRIERPADLRESWRIGVDTPDGEQRTAFVDPAVGLVLGSMAGGGIMETVKELHSLAITGPVGNALIEIVAGWAILLCATGFVLWWPRGTNRALALRGHPRNRRFWRDFHGSVGALVGAILLFLALTGMSWSGVWGDWLRQGVNAAGLGRPAPPTASANAHADHETTQALPWSMRDGMTPMGHPGHMLGPNQVATVAAERGMRGALILSFPKAAGAPWVATVPVTRVEDSHVLFIDPANGAVLQDARYTDFGKGAQAIEWGIYTHQGQQYGEANRLVMLAGCIGIWLLALSAPILWWKRRSGGRLSPPPVAERRMKGITAVMLAVGAFFPLTGATMVAALLGERLWRRNVSG